MLVINTWWDTRPHESFITLLGKMFARGLVTKKGWGHNAENKIRAILVPYLQQWERTLQVDHGPGRGLHLAVGYCIKSVELIFKIPPQMKLLLLNIVIGTSVSILPETVCNQHFAQGPWTEPTQALPVFIVGQTHITFCSFRSPYFAVLNQKFKMYDWL